MPRVNPIGPPNAKICICGEQPGAQEFIQGKPFVGPAGQCLDECLDQAGIMRSEVYITNVIKTDGHLSQYMTDKVITEKGRKCLEELGGELTRLNPNVIVALGNTALYALTSRTGITNWRGSILESTLLAGLKVIPTFHPATVIQPKFNFLNKPLIVMDLKKAVKESKTPEINLTPRKVFVNGNFNEARDALAFVYEKGLENGVIDWDIEIIEGALDCLSFAWSPSECVVIPFSNSDGNFWNPPQEVKIMRLIARIIEEPKIAKRGAFNIFDIQWMFNRYGIVFAGEYHDTQIAEKIAFPDFVANLGFVTSLYTDIPYYKSEGKEWMKKQIGVRSRWWQYNGYDSLATADAHPKIIEVLENEGNIPTYNRQRKLIGPLLYMMERGIKIDVEGMSNERDSTQKQIGELQERLNREVGYELNINSPKQVMEFFYEKQGFKPYKKRGTGKPTVDVFALKRLKRRGSEAASIILDLRGFHKRLGTYLNIGKVDSDGRYRSQYNPVGAETGRLSSSETIFGKGGNQQNWPHDLLRFFAFDEGYIGYSFDLSQAENRIVAYVGNVEQMIEAFELGLDVHRITAGILLGKSPDEISDEEGSSDIGDGRHSERYWGKKTGHAANYNMGRNTFALTNEIPENVAGHLLQKYHLGFPGIRHNYHPMVQRNLLKNRTLINLMGRRRVFMGPVIERPPVVRREHVVKTFNEAYAQIPQSTVADVINERGLEYIYYDDHTLFEPVELLAQIHDSVVFQIPLSISWINHARILLAIKESLETPLHYEETTFTIPADLAIGFNMYKKEMKEIKGPKFPIYANELAAQLEGIHAELTRAKG